MTKRTRDSSIRLIERVYAPRITGLSFAFIAVSSFLLQKEPSLGLWVLLIIWTLIWPHIAFISAKKAKEPFKREMINLFIDAFMIGFWVPVMSFSIIPSIAILGMHLLSIMSVLGLANAVKGLLTELAGVLVAVLIVGLHINPEAHLYQILASIPMLIIYPLFVGYNAYNLSLKLAAKQSVLRKLSRTDGLTGLNNRMYWGEQLDHCFKLNQRNGAKASIVFVDVDHFKKVNDTYGHIVGDKILQKIASLLLDCARETDICGRYGGEEFCILMPDTDNINAEALSERLRLKVENSVLHKDHPIKGTISLGVAEISADMLNYSDWLAVADKALYQAKKQGRNQTVVAFNLNNKLKE